MSDHSFAPNEAQARTLDDIHTDYGVISVSWHMAGWLRAVDGDEDVWLVDPDGKQTLLGGATVAHGPEPEEEES